MLLILLSCTDAGVLDSAGQPDFPALSAQWQQAELRCEGRQVQIRAWTTGPGSTAVATAQGTQEDGSSIQASTDLSLESEDAASGTQAWAFSGSLELLPCSQIDAWQLVLSDARGQPLHCMNQDQDTC